MQNEWLRITTCWTSSEVRPGSVSGEPIVNCPAEIFANPVGQANVEQDPVMQYFPVGHVVQFGTLLQAIWLEEAEQVWQVLDGFVAPSE
jgi:hypothetical protein